MTRIAIGSWSFESLHHDVGKPASLAIFPAGFYSSTLSEVPEPR
jgi:hypothetical protein